jgi:predicted phosphoribosyltransferase
MAATMAHKPLHNRKEAGRLLAQKLTAYANHPEVTVLALPPGGVLVGYYVARELNAPLDVFIVRTLVEPGEEHSEMGAVAAGGVRVLNDEVIEARGIPKRTINAVAVREQEELKRLERLYRGDHPMHSVRGRTAILVDDGLARDATLHAAIKALRTHHPARIVVALPAAPAALCSELRADADEVICAILSEQSQAAGDWYEAFEDVTDDQIARLLSKSKVAYRAPKGAAPAH